MDERTWPGEDAPVVKQRKLQTARLIGGAGTGKTTALMEIIEKLIDSGIEPEQIGFASFTRAARLEAVDRMVKRYDLPKDVLLDNGWFRTVHSISHKMIRPSRLLTGVKADQDWLEGLFGKETHIANSRGTSSFDTEMSEAGKVLVAWGAYRLSMGYATPQDIPVGGGVDWDKMINFHDWFGQLNNDIGQKFAVDVVTKYELHRQLDDIDDFTSLVGRYAGVAFNPEVPPMERYPEGDLPEVQSWLFDEQQDTSPLLDIACRRLSGAPSVRYVYLAGDPFQCQPEGTRVLVSTKYPNRWNKETLAEKNIEDLDPETDWLVAWSPGEGKFYGTGKQIPFKIASREVDSKEIIDIVTEGGDTLTSTREHKWITRLSPPKKELWVVYLMKKGKRWRVGTCLMVTGGDHDNGSPFRLKQRTRHEQADCSWVLSVHESDSDARQQEQIVSCRYGIPQVCFKSPVGTKNYMTAEFIDGVFNELGDLWCNGFRCLTDHGLLIKHPVYTRGSKGKLGTQASGVVHAANLIPGVMSLPKKTKDGGTKWVPIVSVKRRETGRWVKVYSLDVKKYGTYVSDGYVTHNSIYGWSGASSRCFMGWEVDKERIMPKSYRCGPDIHYLGERILQDCPDYWDRKIAPADHDAVVEVERWGQNSILSAVDADDEWLVLTRTVYEASALLARLRSQWPDHHIGWASRESDSLGREKRAALALGKLRAGETISGEELSDVIHTIPMGTGMFRKGSRKKIEDEYEQERLGDFDIVDMQDDSYDPFQQEDFVTEKPDYFQTEKFIPALKDEQWTSLFGEKMAPELHRIDKQGLHVYDKPQVRVSTIHGAKGMGAENVAYLATTTKRIREECEINPAAEAEEARVRYVAVTRAKSRLVIAHPPKGHQVEFPM